jgi:hypothetical protein
LIAISASAAMPADEVPLGDLMCRLQNVGAEAAPSVQVYEIVCVYLPAEREIEEHYSGTLSAIGPPDPLKDNKVLTWVVRGPQALDGQPGVLAQRYGAVPERPPRTRTIASRRHANIHRSARVDTTPNFSFCDSPGCRCDGA